MSGQLPGCPLKFEIALAIRQYMFEKLFRTLYYCDQLFVYRFITHEKKVILLTVTKQAELFCGGPRTKENHRTCCTWLNGA